MAGTFSLPTCSVLTLTAQLSVAVITDTTILDPLPFILPVLYQWMIHCHSVFGTIIAEDAATFATVMLACENAEFRVALVACMNFGVLLPNPVFYHQRRQRRRREQAECQTFVREQTVHSCPKIPIRVARGMFLICRKKRELTLRCSESGIIRVVVMNIVFFVTNFLKLRDRLVLGHVDTQSRCVLVKSKQ